MFLGSQISIKPLKKDLSTNIIFVNQFKSVIIDCSNQYNVSHLMNQTQIKQFSITKGHRWKPTDFLNSHVNKRGRTFFSGTKIQNSSGDPFRKTDFHMNRRFLKEFVEPNSILRDQSNDFKKRRGSSKKRTQIKFQKSPYLSHSTEIQKMMRLLVPVSGPNQSLKLQIKRHNDLNIRNAQLMIVKKTQSFVDRMKAYSSRMGLREDTKLFMMNSRDNHIKNALVNRGWVQSGDKGSILYHLKWVYKDQPEDYHIIQVGQLYNHFKNNQQLTNKNYLRKNIKNHRLEQRPNFPLSYDIEINEENNGFQQAYSNFQLYRVLNILGTLIQSKFSKMVEKANKNINYFSNFNRKTNNKKVHRQQFIGQLLYSSQMIYLKKQLPLLEALQNLFEVMCNVADSISQEKGVVFSIFQSKNVQKDKLRIAKRLQYDLQYKGGEMLAAISPFYITEILKMWAHCKDVVGSNYGFNNMWILKPAGVSRGSGITITSNIAKISQLKYGKILQKYIEQPLLLKCQRKFDIRQWILIKSISPLKVYAFEKCYGRLSSCKYSNENYDNLQKHLTNYTQNKQYYLRQKLQLKQPNNLSMNGTSAMSENQLQEQIPQWQLVKQNILKNILKTIDCCKNEITQKDQCFQIFGFDIILDKKFNPYILEVNMSPACQSREFLGEYLNRMAEGVIDMIQGGEPTNWIGLNLQQFQKRQKQRNRQQLRQEKVKVIQKFWRKKLKQQLVIITQ